MRNYIVEALVRKKMEPADSGMNRPPAPRTATTRGRIGVLIASFQLFMQPMGECAIIIYTPKAIPVYMKHIRTHLKRTMAKTRVTERGELMEYFCKKLNAPRLRDGLPPITMGRMGKLLQKIPTKDLYYLKKVCDDAGNFSKKFWYELNPTKYEK